MVDSAVHLMCPGPSASDGHRQDSCNAHPAGAGGVVADITPPSATSITTLAETPCLTASATLWADFYCHCREGRSS